MSFDTMSNFKTQFSKFTPFGHAWLNPTSASKTPDYSQMITMSYLLSFLKLCLCFLMITESKNEFQTQQQLFCSSSQTQRFNWQGRIQPLLCLAEMLALLVVLPVGRAQLFSSLECAHSHFTQQRTQGAFRRTPKWSIVVPKLCRIASSS